MKNDWSNSTSMLWKSAILNFCEPNYNDGKRTPNLEIDKRIIFINKLNRNISI